MKWFVLALGVIMISGAFIISSTNNVVSNSVIEPQVLSATNINSIPDSMLSEINDFRKNNSLLPLESSLELKYLADYRIADMISNKYYAHKSPKTLKTYADIIDSYVSNSTISCENLQLQNNQQINDAVTAWINSTSHKNCLLNPKITRGFVSSSHYDVFESGKSSTNTYLFVFIGSN